MTIEPQSELSLTPQEERYLGRFFRRRALPYAAATAAVAGALAALALAPIMAGSPSPERAVEALRTDPVLTAQLEELREELDRIVGLAELQSGHTAEMELRLQRIEEAQDELRTATAATAASSTGVTSAANKKLLKRVARLETGLEERALEQRRLTQDINGVANELAMLSSDDTARVRERLAELERAVLTVPAAPAPGP